MITLFIKIMKLIPWVLLALPFGNFVQREMFSNFSILKAILILVLLDVIAGYIKHRKSKTASIRGLFKVLDDLAVISIMLVAATQLANVQGMTYVATEGIEHIVSAVHVGILLSKFWSMGKNLNEAYPGWVPFFNFLTDKMKEKNIIFDEDKSRN